uniref:Nodal modulator 3 n=1 Tax=Plectus sambesii TaxID=2011161 RepID=A0A914VZ87_9BILA
MWIRLLLAVFAFVSLQNFATGQNVYSCGGFVKSSIPISYEKIFVKLYTSEGNLKYETDCAPNNGYYMIPVYTKGTYSVRVIPPKGWAFEPESIELKVDGETDACSQGQDLNFEFKGFAVSGRVRSGDGSADGPAGFALSLLSAKDNAVVQTTKTIDGGAYEFVAVPPGDYFVSGAEGGDMCVSRGRGAVSVKNDRATVATDLVIAGYLVEGFVKDKNQPITGITFSLFSKQVVKLADCASTAAPAEAQKAAGGLHFVCSTKSDKDGRFAFPCVPPGDFVVIGSYSSGGVQFDVVPSTASITVANSPIKFQSPFEIKGFSVVGKVLIDSTGKGAANVDVVVNGRKTAKTDQSGKYTLQQITTGKYTIGAESTDVEFGSVEVQLAPSNAVIPDVVAKGYNLCGSVRFENVPDSLSKLAHRTLILTNKNSKTDTVSIKTDQDGKFCRMVPSGRYELSPNLLKEEKDAGLVLMPPVMDVDLTKGPVKDILFNQFEATLSGQIQCLEPCRKVSLKLFDESGREVKSTLLTDKQQLQKYELTGILPGNYKLHASADQYCWEKEEQAVTIGKADAVVNFRQVGFAAQVMSTSPAQLSWTYSGTKVVKGVEELKAGTKTFCLPVAGKYEYRVQSCHKFQSERYEYDTDNPEPLSLVAVKHLVSGTIRLPQQSAEPLSVLIRSASNAEDVTLGPLTPKAGKSAANEPVDYGFEFFAERDSTLTFIPRSSVYLFTPTKHQLAVRDDCLIDAMTFVGKKGIFLNGNIQPPLDGVAITLKHKTDDALVFNVNADQQGRFKLGPLESFDGFELSAVKEGYLFTQEEKAAFGTLKAFKLSQLTIKLFDMDKTPLGGVLISLSGGVNYRSNNITDDSGVITFLGLSPGEYFVRPIFKEYSFEPQTKTVRMQEGQTEIVNLYGNRVAFSCFGNVRHLAGQSVAQAAVQAVSEGCGQVQEEDVTNEEGAFRLRGLQPGCTYRLTLRPEGQAISGAYPNFYDVTVTNGDVKGRDFVLRPAQVTMEVAGRVVIPEALLASTKVVLYREDRPETPVQTLQLQQASMFYLQSIPIDNSVYIARLQTTLPSAQFERFDLPEISFRASSTFKFLTFRFDPKKRPVDVEISKTSYVALPLAVLIALLGYNYAKVLPFAQDLLQRTIESVQPLLAAKRRSSSPAQTSAEPMDDGGLGAFDSASSMKRRQKIRKT